jgi:hypothetical protein
MLIDEQPGSVPGGSPDEVAADFAAKVRRMQAKFDAVLAVSVTSRCNLRCRHCGRNCTREGTDLSPELVSAICRDLPGLRPRVRELGITGGEPTLVPQAIRRLAEAAAACGCAACVMTNGSWATSPAAAKKIVRSFPGLHAIVISTDRHHLPFVPARSVRNAYEAGRESGLEVRILVTLSPERIEAEDALLEGIREFAGEDLMTQKLKPMGRARSMRAGFTYSAEPPLIPCTTSGPLIREDGTMIPCCRGLDWLPCGHPMCVGACTSGRFRTCSACCGCTRSCISCGPGACVNCSSAWGKPAPALTFPAVTSISTSATPAPHCVRPRRSARRWGLSKRIPGSASRSPQGGFT